MLARPGLENPDPACGWPWGWDAACFGPHSPGQMGSQVGKARNLKACWRVVLLRVTAALQTPGEGTGVRVQDSPMEAHRWGKEGKELVRAPTAESKSAGVARAKASWDPPASPTRNFGAASKFKR